MPGTAALDLGGFAELNSVSCASAGNCAAGGDYADGSSAQPFVVDETNGVWGTAIEVPGMAALNGGVFGGSVSSVSCSSPGNCAAGGGYADGSANGHAFVVNETNGVWGNAIEVPGTADLNVAGDAGVNSVSCDSADDCAAGGYFSYAVDKDGSPKHQAFVVSEHGGVWGQATVVPGTVLGGAYASNVASLSCAGAGDCVAGGNFSDPAHKAHGFVVAERSGTWRNAIKVPMGVKSVSCATPGNCMAGGSRYVVAEKNGKWGKTINLLAVLVKAGRYAEVSSVSCASAGSCAAGGWYTDNAHHVQPFVAGEKRGTWGKAIKVPGWAALNVGGNIGKGWPLVAGVSCASPGNCAATGIYFDSSHKHQAFVVSEQSGVWGKAVEVPGTAALEAGGGYAEASSISCADPGSCAVGGLYTNGSGPGQVFVTAP